MKKIGTALLITAAFIGPGTVTTASLTGANFGFTLVWALGFSVFATYVLQEMASRLGLVTGKGLAEALRESFANGATRILATILVVAAIGVGNAAYQAGNLTGAGLGLQNVLGGDIGHWSILLGISAIAVLATGKYQVVERCLISLVFLMSVVFVVTMFLAQPDWSAMKEGLFGFSMPDGATLAVIALIGTTVVPYNLFLHASLVARNKPEIEDIDAALKTNRWDSGLSIGLGGLVTLAVMSCAVSAFFNTGTVVEASNIATQLEPLLGQYASYFFAIGLFSAGLTSAITAPLAAAYALSGALGWKAELSNYRFKIIWLVVIVVGTLFASIGLKPLAAILFAQAANGLLLPIIAIYLIWVMNQKSLLGTHKNGIATNTMAAIVVLFVSCLGLYKLASLFW
jgi:Mn2+/Fe2+ NRAMP family transporter